MPNESAVYSHLSLIISLFSIIVHFCFSFILSLSYMTSHIDPDIHYCNLVLKSYQANH